MDLSAESTVMCAAARDIAAGPGETDLPEGVEPLVRMAEDLRLASKNIRKIQGWRRNETCTRLADAEKHQMTFSDGTVARLLQRASRREMDREGLIEFVRENAFAGSHAEPETGEVKERPTVFSALLLTCSRQEPRWKQLTQIGENNNE